MKSKHPMRRHDDFDPDRVFATVMILAFLGTMLLSWLTL